MGEEEPPQEQQEDKGEAAKKKAAELEAKKKQARVLRLACYNQEVDAIKELLGASADPSLPDDGLGETSLHYAALVCNREICELLVGAGVKIDIKNAREQMAWDKCLPNGELAGNEELHYYLKSAYFKGLDSKKRTELLEATFAPFLEAEVSALKAAGDETADKNVARLAPVAQWQTFQEAEALKAFIDALYKANGVGDHPFSANALGENTLDTMSEWFLEWGVEKKEEEAPAEGEGNEAPAAE